MADNGNNRLNLAYTRSEEAAASLRQTAQRVHALEEVVTRLASAGSQQAAADRPDPRPAPRTRPAAWRRRPAPCRSWPSPRRWPAPT